MKSLSIIYRAEPRQTVRPQHKFKHLTLSVLSGLAALSAAIPAFAGDVSQANKSNVPLESGTWEKPDWLTDLSLGVKESYDDNVFLSGVAANSAYSSPVSGSVVAVEHASWITTIQGRIGFNFAPLLGDQKVLQTLSLGYAPDFNLYTNAPSENFDIHRFTGAIKGKVDNFSFNLDDAFTYIDGNKYGPTYPGDLLSAFATGADRERRDQFQERANAVFQYDQDKWFVRPIATLLYYDLNTVQAFAPGYQNYVDRYDVNGGVDFGIKIQPKFAFTLGYRYGYQNQAEFDFGAQYAGIGIPLAAAHSPNDYQRVLFGFEGTPWKWLNVKFQIGPDFRNFASSAPISNKNFVTYYGEGNLTATVTRKDTITFKYKQWEWVSSTGLVPYFDSTFDLSYTRKLTDALSWTLGTRALGANYDPNDVAAIDAASPIPNILGQRCERDDWEYTFSTAFQYSFNTHFSANVTYAYNLGVNEQDNLSANPGTGYQPRSFNDQVVSVGGTVKF